MTDSTNEYKEVEYNLKVTYINKSNCTTKFHDLSISVKVSGEKGETEIEKLTSQNHIKYHDETHQSAENEKITSFKLLLNDVGKVKSLSLIVPILATNKNKVSYFIKEIRMEIPYRNELCIFPIDKMLDENATWVLEPNLRHGQVGVHYAITTHTDSKVVSKLKSRVLIQICGTKCCTEFLPLQHSQTNKHAFLTGKRDVFDVIAPDVGVIKKVKLRSDDEKLDDESENIWNLDNLEVKCLNDGHMYNFSAMSKCLLGMYTTELIPISNTEVGYKVILRTFETESLKKHNSSNISTYHHMVDVYFLLKGTKGHTKKICLNNYELKKRDSDGFKERYFEFKSENIGKIEHLSLSINETGNIYDYLCIDFIEVQIPSRSEAYKFPVERAIGEYVDDGKCELDLEVWKHPEKLHFIDYELITESGPENKVEEGGCCFLRIHGNHGSTAKIKFIDTDFDEAAAVDLCEFKAPDCGKITKLELYYQPKSPKSAWQIDSIEIKVKSRNEAYRFPVGLWLNSDVTHIQLEPWRKPSLPQ